MSCETMLWSLATLLVGWGLGHWGALRVAAITHERQLERDRLNRDVEKEADLVEKEKILADKLSFVWILYWRIMMAEMHKSEVDRGHLKRIQGAAWDCLDFARDISHTKWLHDIRRVLAGRNFPSAGKRYYEMERIINDINAKVRPEFSESDRENELMLENLEALSEENYGRYLWNRSPAEIV